MGRVRYRLNELLEKHGVSAYAVARETKQRVEGVRSMRHNKLQRLNMEMLIALCDYFHQLDPDFRLEDLMVYEADAAEGATSGSG